MTVDTPPDLTVVLMVDSQRERAEWALQSVLSQRFCGRLEVLLFDFGHNEQPPLTGSNHSDVRVLDADRGAGYGETMTRAVAAARAPVIAFIEEHVIVLTGWAAAILRAHQDGWAAVCGEVHPGDLDHEVSQRIELVSRNVWSAPAQRGEAAVLRWQNVSYKRDVLLQYQPHLPLLLQAEGALFRQLRADGHRLYIEPDARIIHGHEYHWAAFLRGSFYSNRLSTASALAYVGQRRTAATLRALVSALVGPVRWPVVLLRRQRQLPQPEIWAPIAWANLAYVIQYYAVLALAALIGIVGGPGDSARTFLQYELNERRRKPAGAKSVTG